MLQPMVRFHANAALWPDLSYHWP